MQVIAHFGSAPIKMFTDGVPVEEAALRQLSNIASLPFIYKHVAVMPDVHLGIGATVGSVIATLGAVIPAAVGVDLGCGMMACRLVLEDLEGNTIPMKASDLPDNLSAIRSGIEAAVPHGRTDNGGWNDRGGWGKLPDETGQTSALYNSLHYNIVAKHPKLSRAEQRVPYHMGTLGTGNHFIEMCIDEEQNVWVMLHSGSRGIGNAIGSYFISKAKEKMEEYFITLPDKDLAYLPDGSQDFLDYIEAVGWAQDFARVNRETMMANVIASVTKSLGRTVFMSNVAVNCHHNYVSRENHYGKNVIVTRKGAVRAREGDLGIIPGSMGARSFIVRGLGNRDSFHSCSHGAGRRMSRTEARKTFTLEDHEKATMGVECRKDTDVIDETPAAYKDIDAVMHAQKDLVSIVHTLKQVLCVKG